ncbi:MAG: metallophosphoesterase, partial [Longimicrobiales bacterium]
PSTAVIVAHLSDLHLGFRAYGRVEGGADVRERDVAAAFERAIQEIVRLRPDVIVIAGDVFDRPDPPARAVVALARGLEAFRAALPEAPVLMVAGPRDTPRREGDPGALAVFDSFPNVQAATGLPRSILIERLGLHAALLPHRAVTQHAPAMPEPDPRLPWNLLVLHAEESSKGHPGVHVEPGAWSYVALGGDHRRRKITATAHYSGSLERVALDPWAEAADEKGFLTVDLRTGRVAFHAIPGRPVVALAPVKVGRGDPERVRRRVREVTAEVPGGIAGKIVRLRLEGAAPQDLLALQGEPLRELRARALHLAVEAGKELKVPAEAWLPLEAPRLLREAAAAELERDGRLDEEAAAMLARAIPEGTPTAPDSFAAIEALDGEVSGLGRVSTSIPAGLTAFVGGGGRGRRAVLDLLAEAAVGDAEGPLADLWRGAEPETLEGALRGAVDAVAESRGVGVLRGALAQLGYAEPEATERRVAPGDGGRQGGAVRVDPEQVAAEFRAAERELRESRADMAEVDGDVEVATMDWLRERQDAETTLQAYRDRARELRTRIRSMQSAGPEAPCPTCGRVLEGHYQEVLSELNDQWESVVQDGSWWRSRWEQLELKPAALQEMEGRSLRLHAALEAGSERVELLRARLLEIDRPARGGAGLTGAVGAVVAVLERLHAARVARATGLVLQRASRLVCRISGSRILGLSWDGEALRLEGSEGALRPMSEEDLATAKLAIRLGGASLVAAAGRVLGSLAIEEPFDRLDEETQTRSMLLVRELLLEIPRVILFTRGDVVDACPELFDYVLEVREEEMGGGPPLRPALAGPGRVTFEVQVERKTTRVR